MTPPERERISRSLLAQWDKQLEAQAATPLVLIGLGHNEFQGKAVVCASANATPNDLRRILAEVAASIKD